MIDGVLITTLSVIDTTGGDVLHGMKYSEQGYSGFGEAYFSFVESGVVKGWKRHKEMVLNLIVPVGSIHFVLFDDRPNSRSKNQFQEVILSRNNNYCRLTVPPKIWIGFQGMNEKSSMLLNIANIVHTPDEVERMELSEIKYDWSAI
jgi:dTDP-4-dehydrorhamnose 3,5-epimerase